MRKSIYGVNLGGWLVLEPWITPSLFTGSGAEDEYTFCRTADKRRFQTLQTFRDGWIRREDFQWLAGQGIEAVRIPVGYWLFGDVKPYAGTVKYLDQAFAWAGEFGLRVLVCLHGAPGSQNGEMHSGRQGGIGWPDDTANITLSIETIRRLAERYRYHPALLGIELLNEPSADIPQMIIKDYCRRAYRQIRRICGPDTWVVFSDCFQLQRWSWQMHWPLHRQAYLDNHQYQIYTDSDKSLDLSGHLTKTAAVGRRLRRVAAHRRLIVGEWSAALDPLSLRGVAPSERPEAYARYAAAQLQAYAAADAWFYWTYRTEDGGPWSFRHMVQDGTLDIGHKHGAM